MKRTFHTPQGPVEKELTRKEIEDMAKFGDVEARLFFAREAYAKAITDSGRTQIIAEFLGLVGHKLGVVGTIKKWLGL